MVDRAFAGGYVLALALVCLLQYMFYLFRLTEVKSQRKQDLLLLEDLESDLQSAERDRTLSQLENSILRDVVSESDLGRALEMLLCRYIPDADSGSAAFIQMLQNGEQQVLHCRGVDEEETASLLIGPELLQRLATEPVVIVQQDELRQTPLARMLDHDESPGNPSENGRRELLLFGIHDLEVLEGVLVTSRLFPAGACRDYQIELARRLMASIAGNMQRSRIMRQNERQLWSVREMLELRAITDGRYETPLQMVEEYLHCLRCQLHADQATLYLSRAEDNRAALLLADSPHSDEVPQGRVLNGPEGCPQETVTFDTGQLEQIQGNRGLVLRMSRHGRPVGRLRLVRTDQTEFLRAERELAGWAAEYLSETILRVLSHVAVQRQAMQDGLTELSNRRAFEEQLGREIDVARQEGTACSLLLIDLDRFKSINDRYGHQAGDTVLRSVADVLRDQMLRMRSNDRAMVARYGGEELAVLLPGIPLVGARRIAESMREAIEQSSSSRGQQVLRVTASIGLAEFPTMADCREGLVARADAALYHAKQNGRNQVAIPTTTGSFTTEIQ